MRTQRGALPLFLQFNTRNDIKNLIQYPHFSPEDKGVEGKCVQECTISLQQNLEQKPGMSVPVHSSPNTGWEVLLFPNHLILPEKLQKYVGDSHQPPTQLSLM